MYFEVFCERALDYKTFCALVALERFFFTLCHFVEFPFNNRNESEIALGALMCLFYCILPACDLLNVHLNNHILCSRQVFFLSECVCVLRALEKVVA